MIKFLFIYFFIVSSQILYSQEKLSDYKNICDKIILDNFDTLLIKNVKLVDIFVAMRDSNKSIIINYERDKNKLIDLSEVAFQYQFYPLAIDHLFRFNIRLSKDKKVIQNSPSLYEIPKCLLKNIACYFISKDSAIKIAIGDSILFRENLKIDFVKEYKKDTFYWKVTSSPKKDKNVPANLPPQRRIINSKTGEIIRRN